MPYSTKDDTVTVDGTTYDVERDGDDGRETYHVEQFPGIHAYVAYEQDDASYTNPRTSHECNIGTMYVSYRGYDLGDEGADLPDDGVFEIDCPSCNGTGALSDRFELVIGSRTIGAGSEDAMYALADLFDMGPWSIVQADCPACEGYARRQVDPATYFQCEHGARVVVPLFVYEHSGITIRGGSPVVCRPLDRTDVRATDRFVGDAAGWDTSFVGFLVDDPAKLKLCGCEDFDADKIIEALQGEIREYAAFLEGDVTYFDVQDPETGYAKGCGGFVGCRDEAESECFGSLVSAIMARLAENAERDYWQARDVETVGA